ncbi:MAG: adenosylhomocysteine nucleosidase [Verrucomicrobiota bacterium]
MIAITFALPAESSDFVNLLETPGQNSGEGSQIIRGNLHGKTVALLHTGVGEKVCRDRMELLFQRERFQYLISAGFAGALENELRIGDLLLSENFSSPELLQSPTLNLPEDLVFLGKLLTVPGMIDSAVERNQLATKTGAVAVDMETKFIAEACAKHQTPMLSLRAISDTPSEPFPAPPNVLFDLAKQKTDFARLALYVVMHPGAVSRLNTFRQQIAGGRKNLTAVLEGILQADLLGKS